MLVLAIAARLAQFAGAMALFGAPLFHLYATPWTAASRRLLQVAAWAVLLGAAVSLSVQTASMTDTPTDAYNPVAMWNVAADTQFGRGLLARLAAAAAFAVVLILAPASRATTVALTVVGAGVAASFAWTGHGAAGDGASGMFHLMADVLHLLTASAWLGALAVLGLGVLRLRAEAPALEASHLGLQRFSGIGPAVVGVLILTGLVNSWFLVGLDGLAGIAGSPYGLILVAKLVLFASMLGLAAANRYRLTPRLAAAMDGGPASLAAVRALRASLAMETALALLVLAAVSALGALEPPASG